MLAGEDARRLARDGVLGQERSFGGLGLHRLRLLEEGLGSHRAAAPATGGEQGDDHPEDEHPLHRPLGSRLGEVETTAIGQIAFDSRREREMTTPAEITAAAVVSFDGCAEPRLRELMRAFVRHLHAFAVEVGLTEDEWRGLIGALTATGRITDERRQEFILWSDTLGLSMLVDAFAHPLPEGATESTVLGPFYAAGAPRRATARACPRRRQGRPHGCTAACSPSTARRSPAPSSTSGKTATTACTRCSGRRRPRIICAAATTLRRTARTRSSPSVPCRTRSPTTGLSARCSPQPVAILGARRTFTSSSARRVTSRSRRTSSTRRAATSTPMRSSP